MCETFSGDLHGHAECSPSFAEAHPIAAEDQLLALARAAHAGKLEEYTEPLGDTAELEERFGTIAVRERIADAYPQLTALAQAQVTGAFAAIYDTLPTIEDETNHEHNHHDGGCHKKHGPVTRALEKCETATLGRLRNHRTRAAAALAIRLCSLAICPGDDIAAIGLQTYGAISGQGVEHDEPLATLPKRPRIDFETDTVIISLPLDVAIEHAALPSTPEAHVIREHVNNPPIQSAERREQQGHLRSAVMGSLTLVMCGGLLGGSSRDSMSHATIHPVETIKTQH